MAQLVMMSAVTQKHESFLVDRVFQRLYQGFDMSCAIDTLIHATGGEIYVFGGTIRRVLCNNFQSGDLDLMVPNADNCAFETLNKLHIPFQLNRQGHHRYRWNSLQIDILQPHEFYGGFENVEMSLRFFDLQINALALHIKSGQILDPFRVLSQDRLINPGINWLRWNQMSILEVTILAIRLLKIMHEIPGLSIPSADVDRLKHHVVPRIWECDWSTLYERFPGGKRMFLRMFTEKVCRNAAT